VKEDKEKDRKIKSVLDKFAEDNEGAQVSFGSPDFGRIQTVESGVWSMDKLTDGFPKGQFIQIAGPSQVGKTSFASRMIGTLQKKGLVCAFANNERRFSIEWAEANGVDSKRLIGGNFTDLEQCLDFCIRMASTKVCDCLVVDTITALASRGELMDKKGARSVDDNTIAQIARKLSQFFRMATASVADSGMVVILINQIRKDLSNVMFVRDTTSGGNALEHMTSLKLFIRRAAKKLWPTDAEGKEIGHLINATLLKASHSMNAKTGEVMQINFFNGRGFDNEYDLAYHARIQGLITKEGSTYTYTPSGEKKEPIQFGAGAKTVDSKFKDLIIEHKLAKEIAERILKMAGTPEDDDSKDEEDE
jgi:recombination protein RecA